MKIALQIVPSSGSTFRKIPHLLTCFFQLKSRQCICKIYLSPAVDPKSIKGITEPAKELCAWTNALVTLIEEIDFTLRSKEKIHDLYTAAEIDLAAIISADEGVETPEER